MDVHKIEDTIEYLKSSIAQFESCIRNETSEIVIESYKDLIKVAERGVKRLERVALKEKGQTKK